MAKKPASTRLEDEIMQRIERVAQVDRRTIANIIEICVEEHLPELEEEIARRSAIHETSIPYKIRRPKKG